MRVLQAAVEQTSASSRRVKTSIVGVDYIFVVEHVILPLQNKPD